MKKRQTATAQANTQVMVADISVPNVLAKIEKALAEQEVIRTTSYRTGGSVDGFGNNLKDEKEVGNVIRMFSKVQANAVAYNDATSTLELETTPVFTFKGSTLEDWKIDCQLRIKIITLEDRLSKLQKARDIMTQFLSEDDKKKQALADVAGLLGMSFE